MGIKSNKTLKKAVLVVESPTKAKILSQYFHEYHILSTKGHFRLLEAKKDSISPDLNFKWKTTKTKIDPIRKAVQKTPHLIIATDLDREGEAIGYHLLEELKGLKFTYDRITFSSITKESIQQAILSPRKINYSIIKAYLNRVFLDFFIGFELSPILWKFVAPKLSAGRVQNPTLNLLLEKFLERLSFKPVTTYNIELKNQSFTASLSKSDYTKDQLTEIIPKLLTEISISDISITHRNIKPKAPFITSTLQQEAFNKYGYGIKTTMQLAQKLYEGVEIDNQLEPLITYMRTDSTHINPDFTQQIRNFIDKKYNNLNSTINTYSNKKNSQEAHEAIRIINLNRPPGSLNLPQDLSNIYSIIWNRTLSSQMIPATMESRTYIIYNNDLRFTFTNSFYTKSGFMILTDHKTKPMDISIGDKFNVEINLLEKISKPPKNYSESSMVKTLESHGIGRPSTYGHLIEVLKKRKYVKQQKSLELTSLGVVVALFNREFFPTLIDYTFTQQMEESLNAIANNQITDNILIDKTSEHIKNSVKELSNKTRGDILGHISNIWNKYQLRNCDFCQSELIIKSKFSVFLYCKSCDTNLNIIGNYSKQDHKIIFYTNQFKQISNNEKKMYLSPKLDDQSIYNNYNQLLKLPITIKNIEIGSNKYGFYEKKEKLTYITMEKALEYVKNNQ